MSQSAALRAAEIAREWHGKVPWREEGERTQCYPEAVSWHERDETTENAAVVDWNKIAADAAFQLWVLARVLYGQRGGA